jgi:hypothetical protein
MGMFDDLVPAQQTEQGAAGGLFDDLIPPSPPPAAVDTKKYPYSAENPPPPPKRVRHKEHPTYVSEYIDEAGRAVARGATNFVGQIYKGASAGSLSDTQEADSVAAEFQNIPKMDDAQFAQFYARALKLAHKNPDAQRAIGESVRMVRNGQAAPNQALGWRQMLDTRTPQETAEFKTGQAIQDYAQRQFPQAPEFKDSWTSTIAEAGGSTLPYLATALAGPLSLPLGMLAGIKSGEGEALDRALQHPGTTNKQVLDAATWGAIPGATEQLPIEYLLRRIPVPVANKFGKLVVELGKQAFAEGGQEAVNQLGQNLVENYVYNPDKDLTEGVLEAAGIGAIVGGTMQVAVDGGASITDKIIGKPKDPGTTAAPGKTDRQTRTANTDGFSVQSKGQRIEPRLFDDLIPETQQNPASDAKSDNLTETRQFVRLSEMDETDILRQTGYSLEQIADMNPAERAQAAQEARQQGIEPIGTIAPGAPPVGTSATAPGFGTRKQRASIQTDQDMAAVRPVVNAQPSEAQAAAGNYQKGHINLHGLDISIENPKGSVRRGTDPDTGEAWQSPSLPADYGYVKGTKGKDGDHVDVYIGPNPQSDRVYVIDQVNLKDGKFDEHKAVLAANSPQEAVDLYVNSFDVPTLDRIGDVTEMSVDEFKAWSKNGRATKRPAGQIPQQIQPDRLKVTEQAPVEPVDTAQSLATADKAFDSYMASRKPLTPEGFAAASGLDVKAAGRAIQRAALAGRVIQTRSGKWVRAPQRSTPINAVEFIASLGGIQDVTGELKGMDLPKMTPYGPVVRKTGLHPDKVREALVEAGYLQDAGRDTGGQAQTTVDDVYQLLDAHMRGQKAYSVQYQAWADDVAATKRNEQIDPEWRPIHPVAQIHGLETWEKVQAFFADSGTSEETWSPQEVSDAARLVAEGMDAGDAFERAAFLQIEERSNPIDPEAEFPEVIEWMRARDQYAMELFGDMPPFPDVEQPRAAQPETIEEESNGGAQPVQQAGSEPADQADAASDGAEDAGVGEVRSQEAGQDGAAVEPGADNLPQTVLPGAEAVSEAAAAKAAKAEKARKELEARRKQSKLRKSGQESVEDQDGGLFGGKGPKQSSLLDATSQTEQAEAKPNSVSDKPNSVSVDDAFDSALDDVFGAPALTPQPTTPKPKTATAAATSAVKNTAMALDDVAKGLSALFGGKNKLSSGFTFDEDTYAQALPFFKAGVAHFKDAGKDVVAMVRALVGHLAKAGMDRPTIENMRPYVARFINDITSGKESLDDTGSRIGDVGQEGIEPDQPGLAAGRPGGYAIKPSFNSIDSILRGLKDKAAKYHDNSEIEASIERMDAMSKMPFAQQKQLEAKKKALNDLRNDLELNPVPPPPWLRHGAPIDTLIYVDGKPRPVTGHKWNKDGYFVITDEGLVPYREARTDSGDYVFEEKEFTVPVDKTAVYSELSAEAIKQGWEAKEINGEWHIMAPGGYVAAAKGATKAQAIMAFNMDPNYSYLKNKTERQASPPLSSVQSPLSRLRPNKFRYAISDRQRRAVVADVQESAQRILGHHLQKVMTANDLEPFGFSSDEDGVFDPNTGVIWIALQGAQDPRSTIRHEAIHALRQAGVFTKPEWAALSRMAASEWIDRYNIRDRYEQLYRERFDLTDAQIEELLTEEAVADAFAYYMDDPRGEDVIARIFEKLRRFLEAVRSALKGQGFTTASQVFSNIDRGVMGRRDAGTGTSREFMLYGRQGSQGPLSSRGRQAPPRNPAQGSFEAPHDERVRKALFDSTDTLLSRIRRAASAGGVEFRRKVQDREIDLLRTQGAITQAAGPIAEPQDAYLAASLYPGRVAQRDRDLVTDVIEPLVEDIARRGLTLDEVDQFNRARHAFERNIEIGKLYRPGEQFHDAMFNPSIVGGSGMSDDQASDILNAAQQSGKYADLEAVGDKIVALNAKTLDSLLAEGLIEQEQYDALKAKYRYYVPLRGHTEATDDTHPDSPRTGSRYDIRGKEFQQAYGRTSEADSTLAYSILQARQAIIRIEKNRVGKRFLRLAQANPNEAFWQINRKDMKKIVDKNTGLVRNVYDPGTTQAENVYAIKVGGKAYHVTIHHTGLLRAMKGIGAENMHGLVVAFYKINRFLAGMNTSYDPEFIFRNLLRDLQQTGIVLQEEKIRGLTRNVLKSMPKAAAGMNAMLRGDTNTEWSRYARDYADAGGKMGFMGMNDIATEKASLERLMKEQNPSASLKAWMVVRDEVVGRLDRYNDSIENTLRLATYVHMRKAGVSRDKAASAARELTVNFNRKGEWSSGINAFYMFFNAAMQGGATMAMRLARSKTVRRVCFGIMVAAFLQDMLNRMLAGDDDDGENRYDKIPDEIKAKNGIIMLPKALEEKYGVPYLKWPLPLGYNMFHIAGTQVGHAVAGARSPLEAAGETVGAVADAFNPLGTGGTLLNFFAPTLLDPAADIATNTDYFGEDIMPRSYDDTQPNSDRYKPNIAPWAKAITDFLNEATGGSPERKGAIDWSPEWVEHIFDFAAGGVGRLISRSSTVADNLMKGDDVDANKVPFARVFTGQSSKFTDRDTYNQIKDAVHVTEKEIEARKAEGDTQEVERLSKKYGRELRMIEVMKTAERQMTKLRKDYRAMKGMQGIGEKQRKERLDAISRRMDAIQLMVRQRWNSAPMTTGQ